MNPGVFDEFLSYIEIDIMNQTAVLREPIPAKMKLEKLFIIYLLEWVTVIYSIYFVFIELLWDSSSRRFAMQFT